MAVIWGPNNPTGAQTNAALEGDIFVSRNQQNQRRMTGGNGNAGGTWVIFMPPETRADVAVWGGVLNDRLAKASGESWDLTWANAAAGVVGPTPGVVDGIDQPLSPVTNGQFTQTVAASTWNITHNLGKLWVDVEVISPGQTDPTAPQTMHEPEVEYLTDTACRLHFLEDVVGTAIVRR